MSKETHNGNERMATAFSAVVSGVQNCGGRDEDETDESPSSIVYSKSRKESKGKRKVEKRSGETPREKNRKSDQLGRRKRKQPLPQLILGKEGDTIQWTCYIKRVRRKRKRGKQGEVVTLHRALQSILSARPHLGEGVLSAVKHIGISSVAEDDLSLDSGTLVAMEIKFRPRARNYIVEHAHVAGPVLVQGRRGDQVREKRRGEGALVQSGDIVVAYNDCALIGGESPEGLHFASAKRLIRILRRTTWPCILTLQRKVSGQKYHIRVLM